MRVSCGAGAAWSEWTRAAVKPSLLGVVQKCPVVKRVLQTREGTDHTFGMQVRGRRPVVLVLRRGAPGQTAGPRPREPTPRPLKRLKAKNANNYGADRGTPRGSPAPPPPTPVRPPRGGRKAGNRPGEHISHLLGASPTHAPGAHSPRTSPPSALPRHVAGRGRGQGALSGRPPPHAPRPRPVQSRPAVCEAGWGWGTHRLRLSWERPCVGRGELPRAPQEGGEWW